MLFALACKMREHCTFKPCSLLTYAWEYQAYLSCVCAATKARRSARCQQARNLWQCALVRILWSQCGRACIYFLEHLSKLLDKKQFYLRSRFHWNKPSWTHRNITRRSLRYMRLRARMWNIQKWISNIKGVQVTTLWGYAFISNSKKQKTSTINSCLCSCLLRWLFTHLHVIALEQCTQGHEHHSNVSRNLRFC